MRLSRLQLAGLAALPVLVACGGHVSPSAAMFACSGAHLHARFDPNLEGGNSGSEFKVLKISNDGSGSCTLNGYPTVSLLTASRAPTPPIRQDHRDTTLLLRDPGPGPVSLPVGRSVYVGIAYGNNQGGHETCTRLIGLTVRTAPLRESLLVPADFDICDGEIGTTGYLTQAVLDDDLR